MSEVRAQWGDMLSLLGELRTEIQGARKELREDIKEIRADIQRQYVTRQELEARLDPLKRFVYAAIALAATCGVGILVTYAK